MQKSPKKERYIKSLFNSETTPATNYSIRSNAHSLTVQKQDKLALNPFDDKRLYLNPLQSLPLDKHTQKSDCRCIYCLKLIGLYYTELTEGLSGVNCDEELYLKVWYLKENQNHQQLLNLISDRAPLL